MWSEMFALAAIRVVEKGVFFYRFMSVPEAPDASGWLLVFYDAFPIVAFIDPPGGLSDVPAVHVE